ncbi:MAG: hypothetical protein WCF81_01335 [Roseiarcus sp.]
MTTEAEIRKIVSEVMQARFASRGLTGSDIVFDEDFDGDKIVRVTAHFNQRPDDTAESLFDARDAIRARLIEAGEDRFVFVSRDYPGAFDEGGSDEETERTRPS